MPKTPNPCIDVCKFKREGHCIGCSMTKAQKSIYKGLKKDGQRAGFVTMLMAQQNVMGKYAGWRIAYAKKCTKKGAEAPFDLTNETID
ncbi:DUF1289 domain-containing protein [Loktanella sp. D2R18]|uniref:DUF1289 domain-containing protein n=1 Tax=Rhodobacterales TaxID=204455 RepID=UPI000DEAE8BB|nr:MULTISPECIES: DUF1289 domain-containing protein [Rhodobacterales]MDO6588806.1 DUF1289 domain-containing protein [Yoonia sp. 1_MG-2023]RBW41964.1 DUF1289 domain-containing protein [Loktanella sp. D2R18]